MADARTDYDELRVDRADGVATVTLDSTSKFNALNDRMGEELFAVATDLVEDDEVRCIVLTATGGAFCAGADLASLDGDERDGARLRALATSLHDAITQLHQAGKPVVVGVNGVAAGAGFSLALTGDVVLVSDAARMEFAYSRIGLTGDGGSTFYLPRLVGLRVARELVLLDEPISPERAVDLGLASEVVPAADLEETVADYARRLADGPTAAFGATKELLLRSFDRSLEGQLAAETDAIARATHTEDYERGYEAFFGDADAEFVGR